MVHSYLFLVISQLPVNFKRLIQSKKAENLIEFLPLVFTSNDNDINNRLGKKE